MAEDRIRIFLASPKDLKEHRELAREVAADVDRNIAGPLGARVELTGWEDLRPGHGRPQDLINPAVDLCDVFVGILGKRWGDRTGSASSGFLEEYKRVVRRIENGEEVLLWIYLLDLDDEDLEDAGPQLQKVLDFRDRLYRTALIRKFRDGQEFARLLQSDLAGQVTDQYADRAFTEPEETPTVSAEKDDSGEASRPSDEASAQALEVLRAAETAGAPDGGEPSEGLDPFQVARLQLLSATWMSVTRTNAALGVHEANVLYGFREQLQLQPAEAQLILRTMCEHPPLAPGWGIIGGDEETDLTEQILNLGVADRSTETRAGALDLLDVEPLVSFAGEKGIEGGLREVVDVIAGSNHDGSVRERLAALLSRSDDVAVVEPLRALAVPEEPGADDVVRLLIAVLVRRGEFAEALRLADTRMSYLDKETKKLLDGVVGEIDSEILRAAITAAPRGLRAVVVRELAARGELDETACWPLLDDASLEVRVLALEALCAQGADVDEEVLQERINVKADKGLALGPDWVERARRAWLSTWTAEDLEKRINWVWLQTDDEYAVLADQHFESFGNQVRRDLGDEFQTFRQESIDRLREEITEKVISRARAEAKKQLGEEKAKDTEGLLEERAGERVEEKLAEWIGEERYNRMSFARAALEGIRRNATSDDAALVRPWAEDSNRLIRTAALLALAEVGEAEDAERLADAAAESHGDEAKTLAQAALRLDPSPSGPAARLLEQRSELAAIAAWHLSARSEEVSDELVLTLVNHEVDEVRRAGVACAAQKFDRDGLHDLLITYLAQDRRFYNVVWLLDRLLSGPSWLRQRTHQELTRPYEPVDQD